jgi:predicted MarR family transcription regulator
MADLSMPVCTENTAPTRRLIAAGLIRRTPSRTITVRVTAAGATGIIAKAVIR